MSIRSAFISSLMVIGVGASLSGCLTAAALHQEQERKDLARLRVFDPAAHAWALAAGPALQGSLELTASFRVATGGGVRRVSDETLTCEGLPLRLIPDSPHIRWLMDWAFRLKSDARGDWRRGRRSEPDEWIWPEAESAPDIRETTCGPGGAFTFPSVPAGSYLLLAKIRPTSDRAPYEPYDLVLRPVEVQGPTLQVHIRSDDWLAGPLLPD